MIVGAEMIIAGWLLWSMDHIRLAFPGIELVRADSGLLKTPLLAQRTGNAEFYLRELRASASWEFACLLLCVMTGLVVATTFRIARDSFPSRWRRIVWSVAAIFWGLVAAVTVYNVHAQNPGFDGAEAVLHLVPRGSAFVRGVIDALNIVMIVACPLAVAIAAVALLHGETGAEADARRDYNLRLQNLNLLLYLGAALLVAGTLEIWSFYSWPAAYVEPTHREKFFTLAQTMSGVMGGFFSLLLASIYIPTLAVLRAASGDGFEVLKEDGAPAHWIRPLLKVAVMLAPIAAGVPLAEALKSFAK